MQFHPTGTDPTGEARLVCRNARIHILIMLLVFWAIAVGIWFGLSHLIAYAWGAVCLFLTPMMMESYRSRGRADNWIVAVSGSGIWLNIRDVEYHQADPGQTVVFIFYTELVAARRFTHRYQTESSDGPIKHKDIYLELLLNSDDAVLLNVEIKDESKRELPPRGCLFGLAKSTRRRTNAPISVHGDNSVRVKFSASGYGLTPNIRKTLEELKQYVTIETEQKEELPNWQQLDEQEFNQLVTQLVKNGQIIDAVGLLRSRKNMSLLEAKQFVEELKLQTAEQA